MGFTILLVEDNAGFRQTVRMLLEASGYRVLEAGDGSEALMIAEQHTNPIQLLITDLALPGVKGEELARRLTALYPSMKVLYVSGYSGDAVSQLAPGTSFMEKPFSLAALLEKLRELMGEKT